jgi:hypothetical protein
MKFIKYLIILMFSLQLQAQESFDPFIDYSEFEVASEEEADVNFFRNGRFLTLALPLMQTSFTDTMGQLFSPGLSAGLSISYFFDLRFALQIQLLNSSHAYSDPEGSTGTAKMNSTLISAKYFFNMQNVTKGLANWNPYIIGGMTQAYRRLSRSGSTGGYAQDGASGFHIGGGVEIPIASNKMYIATEVRYTLITFPDENQTISDTSSFKASGDPLEYGIALGVNF